MADKKRIPLNICGKKVKWARTKLEMHQLDVSIALEEEHGLILKQHALSAIELGDRVVKDSEIVALAEVLNVHPMWLLFGDDIPEKYK